jgi:single-strand selective monofunctional uracil DNA glycosylase
VFLEASGRNFTPDKLPAAERRAVEAACDDHLAAALAALQPQWAIGVGGFAERCLRRLVDEGRLDGATAGRLQVAQILHPSPASPAANRGWAPAVERTLGGLGLLPAAS